MNPSALTRRLAAILIADVVGFSRHMERDDAGAFSRLREIRERIIDPKIAEHGGRVVKTAGDGMLLEFGSADAALRCAIEVQRAMAADNPSKAPAERIEFRIGINLGDIIVDGTDIAGDGVNVAARLEALAKPGGICVSSAVREQVHGSLDVSFIDAGEQQVKNIARPIRVFAVDMKVGATMPGARAAHVLSTRKLRARVPLLGMTGLAALALAATGWWAWQRSSSLPALPLAIALMPLSTTPGNAESRSFTDGISKDLAVAVGRSIRGVPVLVETRASDFTETAVNARVTARDLNARYLVEGDVRRTGGQVAVTLQLIDGEIGSQAWSTQVSLPEAQALGDAGPLINRLVWRLSKAFDAAEISRAQAGRASKLTPADLVARAYALWTADVATALEARKLFDAALRIDPSYVPAILGRAWTLNHEFEDDPNADRERIVHEMDSLAQRAIDIDPRNSKAWRTRATALGWQGRYDSAREANAEAIRLDPSNKDAFMNQGWVMDVSGQAHNTLELLAKSRAIDPDVYGYEMDVACEANVLLGRFKDGAEACSKAAALENWAQNQVWLIAALAQLDDPLTLDAAKKELLLKQPRFTIGGFKSQNRSTHPVWVKQADENLYAGLRKAGLPE